MRLRPTVRAVALVTVLLASTLAAPASSQVKATTVPVSRDVVTLGFLVNGVSSKVGVQNGGLARVALKGGPVAGVVPVIRSQSVEITLFDIVADPVTGNEGLKQVGKLTVNRDQTVHVDQTPLPFDVTFLDVTFVSGAPPTSVAGCATCCVDCGGTLTCGCWVIAPCGQCCCAETCPCPWSPAGPTAVCTGPQPSVAPRDRR